MKNWVFILSLALFSSVVVSAQTHYIGMKKAKAIALEQVKGSIRSAEREKENGKVIYSFDIRTADGKTSEVNVDAVTGAVLENKIETPAEEAKEKMMEKKKH